MRLATGLLMVLPMVAHHSIPAEYDINKIVVFKGTVTRVEFMNPHAQFYLDIVEPDGKVINWVFETLPPNTLKRMGLDRDFLKEGDEIGVDAFVAKDGRKSANARTLIWPDGRTMALGDGWGMRK